MDPIHCCKQKLEELVVVMAIYTTLTDLMPAELLNAVHAMSEGDLEAAEAVAAAHAGCSCSGVLQLTAEAPGEAQQLSASLVFAMPPAYPAAAALQVHVTSTGLPRTVVDGLSKLVQEQAAAAQGSACLYDVAATLQQELNQLQQQQQQGCRQQGQHEQVQQQQAEEGSGLRRVLLRLDHMRDGSGYTAIIKQWATELQLTGWLLFWRSFILILLEGSSRDISSYLRQARTVCVDVDSNGRRCRERMLTILEDSAAVSAPDGKTSVAISDGSYASNPSSGTDSLRSYSSFSEVHPDSLEDVVGHLSATHPAWDAQALRQMLGLA